MSKKIDLHMHSTASDGKNTPSELIDEAMDAGLAAIALTDHDSIGGLSELIAAGAKKDFEVVTGVELEINDGDFKLIHVVGLFFDHTNNKIKKMIMDAQEERIRNKKAMIKKINSLGYKITMKEVEAIAEDTVGRPHIARILVQRYPDEFKTVSEVFDKLLGNGKPGFVPREKLISFKEAIEVIHAAGGIAILAHPFLNKKPFEVLDYFLMHGGDGVETIYPYSDILKTPFDNEWIKKEGNPKLMEIIEEKDLLESGGNDYHGVVDHGAQLGELEIPYYFLEKMKEKLKR
jgi:3',5'-nucleoside bisphosphate phosphatase